MIDTRPLTLRSAILTNDAPSIRTLLDITGHKATDPYIVAQEDVNAVATYLATSLNLDPEIALYLAQKYLGLWYDYGSNIAKLNQKGETTTWGDVSNSTNDHPLAWENVYNKIKDAVPTFNDLGLVAGITALGPAFIFLKPAADILSATQNILQFIQKVLQFLLDPNNWIRIFVLILGLILTARGAAMTVSSVSLK